MSEGVMTAPAIGQRKERTFHWLKFLMAVLLLFYIDLPLDRGFPAVNLAGHPLSMSVALSFIAFVVILVQSKGRIRTEFRKPFFVLQCGFMLVLILTSLMCETPFVAIAQALRYFATFVVNYALLVYLIETYGASWFVRAVIFGVVLSAAIAILDTGMGFRLPMYDKWFQANQVTDSSEAGFDVYRAIGTMGNPILMGTLMMLSVPYVLQTKNPILRLIFLVMVLFAAALTVSRTILLGLGMFVVGSALMYKRRFAVGMVGAAILVGLLLSSGLLSPYASDPRFLYWKSRIGIGGESSAFASESLETRGQVSQRAMRRMVDTWGPEQLLVGEGALKSAEVAGDLQSGYSTIDNAFVTILFERGFIGVTLFFGSFLFVLWRYRHMAMRTLHWYNPLALLLCSISFDFEAYSTFNILAVGSLALVTANYGKFHKPDASIQAALTEQA